MTEKMTLTGVLIKHRAHAGCRLTTATYYEVPDGRVYGHPHLVVECTAHGRVWDQPIGVLDRASLDDETHREIHQ